MPRIAVTLILVLLCCGRADAFPSGRIYAAHAGPDPHPLRLETSGLSDAAVLAWIHRNLAAGLIIDFAHLHVPATLVVQLITRAARGANAVTVYLRNLDMDERLDLSDLHIQSTVACIGCVFADSVDFNNSVFDRDLLFSWSRFRRMARGSRAKIAGDLNFAEAKLDPTTGDGFAGQLDLRELTASRLSLGGSRVEDLLLNDATIHTVDMNSATIGYSLDGRRAQLGSLSAQHAHFQHFSLAGAKLADSLVLDDSRGDATGGGQLDLDSIELKGDLSLRRIVFTRTLSARRAKINGTVLLGAAQLGGEVDFSHAQIGGDIDLATTAPPATALAKANFSGARIDGEARFRNVRFGQLDLSNAKLAILDLTSTTASQPPSLIGASYQRIEAASDEQLLALVDHSRFAVDVYATLESHLRNQGYREQADLVFFHYKAAERAHLSFSGRVASRLLGWFAGYGRRPYRALLPIFFWVLLGWLLFRRAAVRPWRADDGNRRYNAFIFSLDTFAPVIDLHAAKVWTINEQNRRLHAYFVVHRLVGWLCVPFAIAAVTGILK